MRVLHLLRHAKSSWDDAGAGDHARILAPRGRKAAPAMARWMAGAGVAPRLILVSTARRCQETLALMLPILGGAPQVLRESALYLASADDLLARLRRLDAAQREVMVIGHNPGLHDLALLLAGHGAAEDLARLAAKFSTAALASLSTEGEWPGLARGGLRLDRFVRPADLPEL
jgi:phosphohistidine phosphatase